MTRPMKRRYHTVDVFTQTVFGGNPLAVVLDAEGLDTARMQRIAAEFGYSETTFVLPARAAGHDAWVRIFTPRSELPFAGHPNIGTAFLLASLAPVPPARLVFEEAAGSVTIAVHHDAGQVRGATLTAPQRLGRGGAPALEAVAACLSLPVGDLRTSRHPPCVASVGMPFLVAELGSRAALARAAPDLAAHRRLLPFEGADGVYAYVRQGDTLHARMFAPIDGIAEDPATGSATAAVAALLAEIDGAETLSLTVHQGDDMGRPSVMAARAWRVAGDIVAEVGGACALVMQGVIEA